MADGNSEEVKLIEKAVKGDSSAFGLLYDRYQPMIYRFVVVKVGRREEAEDITHQVFMNAWLSVGQYRHRGHPFSSWLYRIARNQVIDYYRSKRETVSLEQDDIEELMVSRTALAGELAHKFELEKVMKAVRALKPDYQDVVLMRFVEDLSLRETAVAMKKTEGAVKLMQHRAIEELKKTLKEK